MIRTAPSAEHRTKPPKAFVPPFATGDKLDRATFHALYLQTPKNFKAELISGVVYVASPVKRAHADTHLLAASWLGNYVLKTPGLRASDNPTTRTDDGTEVQPDLCAYLLPEFGGKVQFTEDGYLQGPPEFVLEVAHSTSADDLSKKKTLYESAGVIEYVVVEVPANRIHWFQQKAGTFRDMKPEDGVWKSQVFPGLWLGSQSLFDDSFQDLLPTLALGLASPEHAAFMAKLTAKAKKPKGKKR
jgi:Uma2 family endonuclease